MYLTPTLQFLWGVLVVGEAMPPERWAGFGLVWLALVVFTVGLVRLRSRRTDDEPGPAPNPAEGLSPCAIDIHTRGGKM